MLIDTHAHLWFPDYYPASQDQPSYYDDLDAVIERAKVAGIEKIIVPGTDIKSSKQAIELAKKYPCVIYAAVGVHPEEVSNEGSNEETPPTFGVPTRPLAGPPVEESPLGLRELIAENRKSVVAIGEIGIDLYSEKEKQTLEAQKILFREQCELALELYLPIIIHTRESLAQVLQVLDNLPRMPRGQFHCFSHDEEGIKQVLERGFCISFCGNITWSKRVAKLVSLVPDDRLLLETDSPFMRPRVAKIAKVPNSGTESSEPGQGSQLRDRNEPTNVRILAEKITELRGQTTDKIEEMTTANANRLYKL